MKDSVLFNSPLLLILFGCALSISAFAIIKRTGGFVLPLVSVVLFAGGLTYALLLGAPMQETLIVALLFLAVNLKAFKDGLER